MNNRRKLLDELFRIYNPDVFLLLLTHGINKENKEPVSLFQGVFDNDNSVISQNPRSIKIMDSGILLLEKMFKDNKYIKIMKNHFYKCLAILDSNKYKEEMELLLSFGGFFKKVSNNIKKSEKNYNNKDRYDCFVLSMFVISLIEKLLRNLIYKEINDPKNDNFDYLNLNSILSSNNEMLNKILGIEVIKILRYWLTIDQDYGEGLNLRNKLMHGIDIKFSDFNKWFLLSLFYLFLLVVNSMIVYE
ncbi:DUF4209 domain-containing protein [Mycoplasmopsis agassizii]|uniref:DUF4209 domain-containing protein n=1 Tax=Mycoplasmopsis agassizii TaxID=33922 RepID=UPI0035299EFF